MAWDESKVVNPNEPEGVLTPTEWNNHVSDQKAHSTRHEDGGADELDVSGLSGVLADAQTPQTEAVEDIINGVLAAGTNITLSYDDENDILTIDTTALNQEEVEDTVAGLVTAGTAITVNAGRENQRTDAAYILESAGTELNRFGVTPGTQDAQTEDGQVQIYVYSLDNQSAKITAQEIVAYLREFLSDNYFGTNFLNIEPTNISDRRASSIARQTDHYVYVVDIQTERLS